MSSSSCGVSSSSPSSSWSAEWASRSVHRILILRGFVLALLLELHRLASMKHHRRNHCLRLGCGPGNSVCLVGILRPLSPRVFDPRPRAGRLGVLFCFLLTVLEGSVTKSYASRKRSVGQTVLVLGLRVIRLKQSRQRRWSIFNTLPGRGSRAPIVAASGVTTTWVTE